MTDFFQNLLNHALSKPERPILLIVKCRYPFATDLHDLDLSDCISVLLVNSSFSDKITDSQKSKFEYVQDLDIGEFWAQTGALSNLDALEFPQLDKFVENMITNLKSDPKFRTQTLRIVAMEEQFVRACAKIRDRYSISGPKTSDVERFTNKSIMKIVAQRGGLESTKYRIVIPNNLKANANQKTRFQDLGYPIMMKPLHGVGASGIEKIDTPSQLDAWITDHPRPDTEYLAEEYIVGIEYWALALVQSQGVQFVSAFCENSGNVWNQIRQGIPLCSVLETDPLKAATVRQFAMKAVEIFKPPENGLVYVQLFMTSDGRLKFNEIGYRVPGMIGTIMVSENSGISPESIQMMAQLKPLDLGRLARIHGRKQRRFFANVVYPKRRGTVTAIHPLPRDKLKSEAEAFYAVKIGDRIHEATNIGDMVVRVFLWNDHPEELSQDCDYLKDNFQPVTLE